ncbi:MAG: universal stress protein [Pseudomonadota bacterium]
MPYKTILVCLTDTHNAERLTRFAAMVAEKFEAHLVGVHPGRQVVLHSSVGPYFTEDLLARLSEAEQEESNKLKEIFEGAIDGYSYSSEWRAFIARSEAMSDLLVEHALTADLIIMSQPGGSEDTYDHHELHRNLILGAGRPILVMPQFGEFNSVGEKVLLAWNGTRESSRAAYESMPFLEKSGDVTILGVEPGKASADDMRLHGHDIAASLARHGVHANVSNLRKGEIPVSDEMLNMAADSGADLLVMGAYGHSRVYDFVLGAATSGILAHMTVPTLFAH